jgi:hypothetical protein
LFVLRFWSLRTTPVARHIVVHPGVEFKSVEGNALSADGNGGEKGPDLSIEAVTVHAEIAGRIAESHQARL